MYDSAIYPDICFIPSAGPSGIFVYKYSGYATETAFFDSFHAHFYRIACRSDIPSVVWQSHGAPAEDHRCPARFRYTRTSDRRPLFVGTERPHSRNCERRFVERSGRHAGSLVRAAMDRSVRKEPHPPRRHIDRRGVALFGPVEHGDAHARVPVAARGWRRGRNRHLHEVQGFAALHRGPFVRRDAPKRMQRRVVAFHTRPSGLVQCRSLSVRAPVDRNAQCSGRTHRLQLRRFAHRIVDGRRIDGEIRPERLHRQSR